ncbi:zinc-binding dehydrogenase [Paracoccus sp. IB05]|uniref:zinc-binding dehydrogenase n=1 Tax=Paracoccus sp. IB05 TaxID=2779367 RepID=UPI001E634957|nr:zinc-binding dehydrogenase [Paracoccus sp. IB05]
MPGHEYCGEVVEAGPLSHWKAGDRVIAPFILACGSCPDCRSGQSTTCQAQYVPGFGSPCAYAEYVPAPHAHNLARLPDSLPPHLAAGPGYRATTAFQALTGRAALQAGEWRAIRGTGGIGLSCLLIGRALGARVIVTDIVPEKLDHALALGAEVAFNATSGTAAEDIIALTGGGAHVSVEALGIEATTNSSLRSLRPLGRHLQIGLPTGRHAQMQVDMNTIYMRQLAVCGSRGMPSWRYPSLIETGRLDVTPIVAHQVALSDASAELAAFDRPTMPGVAVITDFAQ